MLNDFIFTLLICIAMFTFGFLAGFADKRTRLADAQIVCNDIYDFNSDSANWTICVNNIVNNATE